MEMEIFSPLLPNHILLKIASIQLPRPERGNDQIYWLASSKGNFTVRLAYHYLASFEYEEKDSSWLLALRWKRPQTIRTFI